MRNLAYIITAIALLVVLLRFKKELSAVKALKGVVDMTSVIHTSPDELAKNDGVDVDTESLARVGQSEETGESGRTAVMWACKNYAAKRGITITQLVTSAKHIVDGVHVTEDYHGKYTRDIAGKYCSTYEQPNASTLVLAKAIIDGLVDDPTSGAIHWLSIAAWGSKTEESFLGPEQLQRIEVPGVFKTRFYG
jgi:hypothetical protein